MDKVANQFIEPLKGDKVWKLRSQIFDNILSKEKPDNSMYSQLKVLVYKNKYRSEYFIKYKKCCVNPKNDDDEKWSVMLICPYRYILIQ